MPLHPFVNASGDTYDLTTTDSLRPGDTVELDGVRETVDHVATISDPVPYSEVHFVSGHIADTTLDCTFHIVTRQGIPAPSALPDLRAPGTVVHYWSGITLPEPATLVLRSDLRPGDVVHSSHGYRVTLTSATVYGETAELRGVHGSTDVEHIERSDADGQIPVYTRGPEPEPPVTLALTLTRAQAETLSDMLDLVTDEHEEFEYDVRKNAPYSEEDENESRARRAEQAALIVELKAHLNAHGIPALHPALAAFAASAEPEPASTAPAVSTFTSEIDGVECVQIDAGPGRVRIFLNDAPLWDGDPDTDEAPGAHYVPEGR